MAKAGKPGGESLDQAPLHAEPEGVGAHDSEYMEWGAEGWLGIENCCCWEVVQLFTACSAAI